MKLMVTILVMPMLLSLIYLCFLPSNTNAQLDIRTIEDNWKRIDKDIADIEIPKPVNGNDIFERARDLNGDINWSSPELLWKGEPLNAPRGIVLLDDSLYVTDPGNPADKESQPARIVKFPIVNGTVDRPEIFFEQKDFLISAKWAVPVGGHYYSNNMESYQNAKELVVADQGEEIYPCLPSNNTCITWTGKGAKVFTIPILNDGKAGQPNVLWEGSPLVCPTGVTVVDRFVYVTDPCAGPELTRANQTFTGSKLFAIPLEGGVPLQLWEGKPFTSMIGVCDIRNNGKYSLLIPDTDSGRLEPHGEGGRPGFSPPGGAELWLFDILNTTKPELSSPYRIPFTEEGAVRLMLGDLPSNSTIEITTLDPTYFPDGENNHIFTENDLVGNNVLEFILTSPVQQNNVSFSVNIKSSNQSQMKKEFVIPKDPDTPSMFRDNKHAGRAVMIPTDPDTQSPRVYYYTLDNAPGNAAVWLFPEGGGTPIFLTKGLPLVRPLAAVLSPDQRALWISDTSGALFELEFPTAEQLDSLFPIR